MTATTSGAAPPGGRRRSGVLAWAAVAWAVVLAGLAAWSAAHGPATVPEQRSLARAMPQVRRVVGVVYSAAAGPGRAVLLGDLRVAAGCRVTEVRRGAEATRDVTVYVRPGEQRGAVEAIAAGLPADYRVEVTPGRGGRGYRLHADAGEFVGVDLDADVGDSALTLRVSSGCRPVGPGGQSDGTSGGVDAADPSTGPAPDELAAVLAALGVRRGAAVPAVRAVNCPGGGTAGTYTVDGVDAPDDWARRMDGLAPGPAVVRSDTDRRAYRAGDDSVVVAKIDDVLRVGVSRACR